MCPDVAWFQKAAVVVQTNAQAVALLTCPRNRGPSTTLRPTSTALASTRCEIPRSSQRRRCVARCRR
eukprot:735010-Lingulodinium_polyedra.AAC.1